MCEILYPRALFENESSDDAFEKLHALTDYIKRNYIDVCKSAETEGDRDADRPHVSAVK